MPVTCRGCGAWVAESDSATFAADLTEHDQKCPTHGMRRCEHAGARCYQQHIPVGAAEAAR